jgi:PAS domain S-box-containing protein
MVCLTEIIIGIGTRNSALPVVTGLLIFVCSVVVYLLFRLKKTRSDLEGKCKQARNENKDLLEKLSELKKQFEFFEKEQTRVANYYKMLIESADDGISFYDKDGTLKFSNSAFYSVIGLDRDSYNIETAAEFIHPDDRNYNVRRLSELKEKGSFESELRLLHKDGHYVFLSTRSVIVKDESGEIIGSLTISRDITKLKQEHEELIRANLVAETSNKLKSTFLANISHEVRTPLNSVVGFSNLLLADDITREVKEQYFEHITYNSEKLLQIIGDIIDLSRLESSQIELKSEEVSVTRLVKEVIDEAMQVIRRNEKTITVGVITQLDESNDRILSDRIWLKRVLNHLMDNAIKFTLDGSVELSYYLQNGDIVFKIKDTGIGINKENLGRIFEEFQQEIDGHHRPFEGLGIGLTLVKEVIDRMGGKILVQSEKGIGSLFTFSIPYRRTGTTGMKTEYSQKDQLTGNIDWSTHKCLLVDDNVDVLTYLKRILLDTGINIISASSGAEALEIISKTPDLDLILLDLQMPEINGLEVTKEIRKINSNIPVIAQTAYIFEDEKAGILQAGCDACLIKPILKDNLITVMSSFIKSV